MPVESPERQVALVEQFYPQLRELNDDECGFVGALVLTVISGRFKGELPSPELPRENVTWNT